MKRDNGWSRGRSFGRHQGENRKQSQQAGNQKKLCFRCGLTNHYPVDCKYKDSDCFKCHLTGHLQSECRRGRSPSIKFTGKQHVDHTDQDSVEGGSEGTREGFFLSIFSLEESRDLSHLQLKSPFGSKMLNFTWKSVLEQLPQF